MNRWPWYVCLCCMVAGCSSADDRLTIAVASNFHNAATELAAEFSSTSGIPVRLSSGSTGSLYARIVNGAPYDIFLAADVGHAEKLALESRAFSDSLVTYAHGQLVIWAPASTEPASDCLQAISDGQIKHLAMANPDVAPYGNAARQFLQANGAWTSVSNKVVYGESVAQAFQFVATGNADVGLVAASLVKSAGLGNRCIESGDAVGDKHLLAQAGVILNTTEKEMPARRFMQFLQTSGARRIMETHGYDVSVLGQEGS